MPGVIGNLSLEYRMKQGNANIICQENTLIIALVKTIMNNALTNVPTVLKGLLLDTYIYA